MRVAIVYVGNRAPKYVWANLVNIQKNFRNFEVLLISDQEKDVQKAKRNGIQAWKASNVADGWSEVRSRMIQPMEFRNGFWFSTSARFLAIHEYMNHFTDQSLLQIEGDVWTSALFPMDIMANITSEFAFPLEAPGIGVASSLFIRDSAAAKFLADYSKQFLIDNRSSTDMKILGALADQYPKKCLILPSAPPYPKSRNIQEPDFRTSQNFDHFGGIFDGVHWGAYVLGEDPRNHRGIRLLYNREFPWEVKPWDYQLTTTSTGLPAVMHEGTPYPVFSLHVHVKIRNLFIGSRMSSAWVRRIKQAEEGTRREVMPKVVFLQAVKALWRRLKAL